MTAVLVALMAVGLATAAVYPLWKGVQENARPAFTAELVMQDGVAYSDPEELALDRALGRLAGESQAVTVADADLEEELERRVAALRHRRPSVPASAVASAAQPAATVGGDCPQCGHAYNVGDRFCVRCGASLVQACSNCGHPYDAGDLFCAKCGQKL